MGHGELERTRTMWVRTRLKGDSILGTRTLFLLPLLLALFTGLPLLSLSGFDDEEDRNSSN